MAIFCRTHKPSLTFGASGTDRHTRRWSAAYRCDACNRSSTGPARCRWNRCSSSASTRRCSAARFRSPLRGTKPSSQRRHAPFTVDAHREPHLVGIFLIIDLFWTHRTAIAMLVPPDIARTQTICNKPATNDRRLHPEGHPSSSPHPKDACLISSPPPKRPPLTPPQGAARYRFPSSPNVRCRKISLEYAQLEGAPARIGVGRNSDFISNYFQWARP